MFTFRENLDTMMVEIVKNGYVEYEIHRADFKVFAHMAWTMSKYPLSMPKVRNLVDYTIK
jgi:hypothetical protein